MKKSLFVILLLMILSLGASAQKKNHFDPAKFDAELEQFITTEACLSPQESSALFPLYREMRKKQKVLFDQSRRLRHTDLSNDKACADAIKSQDALDIEIKELQQKYHNKFMKILPASKVLKLIRAEEKFHRQYFKRMAKH
ncbi:MAG: hypothetical protein IJS97_00575 [Prevotella sp.]|nr:hypothetical protein [Prevotella sp.]